jgi:hypothetical protein
MAHEMTRFEVDRLREHVDQLIEDVGVTELFDQLDLEIGEVICNCIRRGEAILPPGLEMEGIVDE